jgi:hypothetical protein
VISRYTAMPGHILQAKCACGFERELQPGASITALYVIAYTADGHDIVTIDSREAERNVLTVIDDPWLNAQEKDQFTSPRFNSSWGPYRCPACEGSSLQIWPRGFWD